MTKEERTEKIKQLREKVGKYTFPSHPLLEAKGITKEKFYSMKGELLYLEVEALVDSMQELGGWVSPDAYAVLGHRVVTRIREILNRSWYKPEAEQKLPENKTIIYRRESSSAIEDEIRSETKLLSRCCYYPVYKVLKSQNLSAGDLQCSKCKKVVG